jgi:hypothetical protein
VWLYLCFYINQLKKGVMLSLRERLVVFQEESFRDIEAIGARLLDLSYRADNPIEHIVLKTELSVRSALYEGLKLMLSDEEDSLVLLERDLAKSIVDLSKLDYEEGSVVSNDVLLIVKKICSLRKDIRDLSVYRLAKSFHDEYETFSKAKGWDTQASCKVDFDCLPEANKAVMLAVCGSLIEKGIILLPEK